MATTRASYDPTKAIEGMFNGSVTRIAYALKAPNDYGGSTKTVLAECAKRYHDALDDCEIQLLNAKWYLEHQLKTNQMRREAKAREMGTATKRKHDEINDSNENGPQEQATAKKLKPNEQEEQSAPEAQATAKTPASESQVQPSNANKSIKSPELQSKSKLIEESKSKTDQIDQNIKSSQTAQNAQLSQSKQSTPSTQAVSNVQATSQPTVKPKELPRPPTKEQPPLDDFAKPTPQATPTNTNDEFNFESMFGDTGADHMGDDNKVDDDLEFDFTTGDAFGPDIGSGEQDSLAIDTFLPGLESYANQTDENVSAIPANDNTNNNPNTNLNSNANNANNIQSFSNDFDLPDLGGGGPNEFDAYLNDDDFGVTGGNFEDNIDLSDAAFLDLDLDGF